MPFPNVSIRFFTSHSVVMTKSYWFLLFLFLGFSSLNLCTPAVHVTNKSGCPQSKEYRYTSTDPVRCSVMPVCEFGTPFRNECGCGCRIDARDIMAGVTRCSEVQRRVDYCAEVYAPVCGWFAVRPSDCNDGYCRESFANSCFACKDPRVKAFTSGNCPAR